MKTLMLYSCLLFCNVTVYATSRPLCYVYFGIYGDSTLEAYPGSAISENYVKNRAGIYAEKKFYETPDVSITPFIENEVLMDKGNVTFYSPASSNFIIGLKLNISAIDIIIKHECRHTFEFRSKQQERYNLIEFRWRICD